MALLAKRQQTLPAVTGHAWAYVPTSPILMQGAHCMGTGDLSSQADENLQIQML